MDDYNIIDTVPNTQNVVDNVQAPPHNLEIEGSLIGAILRNNQLIERADMVRPDYFYAPEHATIFTWIIQTMEKGQLATPATLGHTADNDPAVKALGGKGYLARLASDVISVINIHDYASTLLDLHIKRELIIIGNDLVGEAYDNDIDNTGGKQIEKAEQILFNLAENGESENSSVSLGEASLAALKSAENAFLTDEQVVGVTTGFKDMDARLGGLHGSDLLILAGRPAMGKTSLATNLAFNAAKNHKITEKDNGETMTEGGICLFFSLEMSAEQLAGRILSEQSEVPSDKIRRGDITQEEFARVAQATSNLAKIPLYIDDTPALSITALRQRARRAQRKHGLDMIVVDYLQLLQGPAGKRNDSRVNEVSDITRGLKMIAKELSVPVIALSQLSRSVESREDKRPMLSDLRESGSIEQDADVVMFIYRPEYYLQNSHPEKRPNEGEDKYLQRVQVHNNQILDARNVAEVIIAKQRHGPTGTIELFFNGEFTRFVDLDRNHND